MNDRKPKIYGSADGSQPKSGDIVEPIEVRGGIKAGNRVHIRSGEVNGVDLKGLTAIAVRDEQIRPNGAAGVTEEMVTVEVPLATGEMSYPIDIPRRRLKGPKDGLLRSATRWVGRTVGVIRDGKYVDLTKAAS